MSYTITNKTNYILVYDSSNKDVNYWPKAGLSVRAQSGSVILESNGTEVMDVPYPEISSPSSSDILDLVDTIFTYIGNVGYGSLRGGYADYSDSATSGTPIAVAASAGYVTLTNDTLGPFTNTSELPIGVSKLYEPSTNSLYFGDLSIGDIVDIRIDVDVIIATNNTQISISLFLGTGGAAYSLNFETKAYKSAGTYKVSKSLPIYIGDANTRDNPGVLKIDTDTDCSVTVNGWLVIATMRER